MENAESIWLGDVPAVAEAKIGHMGGESLMGNNYTAPAAQLHQEIERCQSLRELKDLARALVERRLPANAKSVCFTPTGILSR